MGGDDPISPRAGLLTRVWRAGSSTAAGRPARRWLLRGFRRHSLHTACAGVALAVVFGSLGRRVGAVWQPRGWPWLAFDPCPLTFRGPVPAAERLPVAAEWWARGKIGPNWAPVEDEPGWRWLRLPNGLIVTFSPACLLANAALAMTLAVLVSTAVQFLALLRSGRLREGHCGHCGYDLEGNASGACPECGTRNALVLAPGQEAWMARAARPARWLREREFCGSGRRAKRALITASALLATMVVVLIVAIRASRPAELMPFRDGVWKDPRTPGQTRYAMAQDLVQRKVLRGLRREELVSLLGSPDEEGFWGPEDCLWRLKCREGLPTEYYWLIAEIDSGRVIDAAVGPY